MSGPAAATAQQRRQCAWEEFRGRQGTPGTNCPYPGRNGSDGAHGADGGHVAVTLSSTGPAVLAVDAHSGKMSQYQAAGEELVILASGGAGGPGGHGARGTPGRQGVNGARGCVAGNGGPGGAGGHGGSGGVGGRGGHVSLAVAAAEAELLWTVGADVRGGAGGEGGPGGQGGSGGQGGLNGGDRMASDGRILSRGMPGHRGHDGTRGRRGPTGRDGEDGKVEYRLLGSGGVVSRPYGAPYRVQPGGSLGEVTPRYRYLEPGGTYTFSGFEYTNSAEMPLPALSMPYELSLVTPGQEGSQLAAFEAVPSVVYVPPVEGRATSQGAGSLAMRVTQVDADFLTENEVYRRTAGVDFQMRAPRTESSSTHRREQPLVIAFPVFLEAHLGDASPAGRRALGAVLAGRPVPLTVRVGNSGGRSMSRRRVQIRFSVEHTAGSLAHASSSSSGRPGKGVAAAPTADAAPAVCPSAPLPPPAGVSLLWEGGRSDLCDVHFESMQPYEYQLPFFATDAPADGQESDVLQIDFAVLYNEQLPQYTPCKLKMELLLEELEAPLPPPTLDVNPYAPAVNPYAPDATQPPVNPYAPVAAGDAAVPPVNPYAPAPAQAPLAPDEGGQPTGRMSVVQIRSLTQAVSRPFAGFPRSFPSDEGFLGQNFMPTREDMAHADPNGDIITVEGSDEFVEVKIVPSADNSDDDDPSPYPPATVPGAGPEPSFDVLLCVTHGTSLRDIQCWEAIHTHMRLRTAVYDMTLYNGLHLALTAPQVHATLMESPPEAAARRTDPMFSGITLQQYLRGKCVVLFNEEYLAPQPDTFDTRVTRDIPYYSLVDERAAFGASWEIGFYFVGGPVVTIPEVKESHRQPIVFATEKRVDVPFKDLSEGKGAGRLVQPRPYASTLREEMRCRTEVVDEYLKLRTPGPSDVVDAAKDLAIQMARVNPDLRFIVGAVCDVKEQHSGYVKNKWRLGELHINAVPRSRVARHTPMRPDCVLFAAGDTAAERLPVYFEVMCLLSLHVKLAKLKVAEGFERRTLLAAVLAHLVGGLYVFYAADAQTMAYKDEVVFAKDVYMDWDVVERARLDSQTNETLLLRYETALDAMTGSSGFFSRLARSGSRFAHISSVLTKRLKELRSFSNIQEPEYQDALKQMREACKTTAGRTTAVSPKELVTTILTPYPSNKLVLNEDGNKNTVVVLNTPSQQQQQPSASAGSNGQPPSCPFEGATAPPLQSTTEAVYL